MLELKQVLLQVCKAEVPRHACCIACCCRLMRAVSALLDSDSGLQVVRPSVLGETFSACNQVVAKMPEAQIHNTMFFKSAKNSKTCRGHS